VCVQLTKGEARAQEWISTGFVSREALSLWARGVDPRVSGRRAGGAKPGFIQAVNFTSSRLGPVQLGGLPYGMFQPDWQRLRWMKSGCRSLVQLMERLDVHKGLATCYILLRLQQRQSRLSHSWAALYLPFSSQPTRPVAKRRMCARYKPFALPRAVSSTFYPWAIGFTLRHWAIALQ
jgi:hypothetical protein